MPKQRGNCQLCIGSTRARRPNCEHPCHLSCFEQFRKASNNIAIHDTDCPECMGLVSFRYCPGCHNKVTKQPGSAMMHCDVCYNVFAWRDRSRRRPIESYWGPRIQRYVVPIIMKTALLLFVGTVGYGLVMFR